MLNEESLQISHTPEISASIGAIYLSKRKENMEKNAANNGFTDDEEVMGVKDNKIDLTMKQKN